MHPGHHDPGQAGQVGGDALGAAALAGQVQLASERTGELTHQLLRAVGFERGQFGLGQHGQAREQAQVGFDGVGDAGAADLDDDFGAVVQLGAVHLRDRRGGQRLHVEAGKNHLGLVAQVFAQLRAQLVQRHGRHLAVQLFEFGDPVGAEQVGAAGQDLAELDEGGAEFFQRQAHLHRRFQPREVGGVVPLQGVAGALKPVGQAETAHAVAEAVADEHAQDGVEAAHVSGSAQGFDQHGAIIDRPGLAGRASTAPGGLQGFHQ